ncbi:MAG: GNAT family N-acetyltransferase [Deinococcales bacterium]
MTKLVWRSAARPVAAEDVQAARRRLERLGLGLLTLQQAGHGLEARKALYELVRLGVHDEVGGEGAFVPFERFDAELFEPFYWRWADAQYLAADGETWVGLVNLQLRRPERAEMGITVVRRAYRRRGIARALKVLALGLAQGRGVTSVVTWNHVQNTPILRLNASLGFRAR